MAHPVTASLKSTQRVFDLYDEYCHGRIDPARVPRALGGTGCGRPWRWHRPRRCRANAQAADHFASPMRG